MDNEVTIALIGAGTTLLAAIIGEFRGRRKLNMAEKQMPDRASKPNLEYHPLFVELDTIENHFMTHYKMEDPGRTELAIELVVNKIRIWRPVLLELAKDSQDCYEQCKSTSPYCNRVFNVNMEYLNKGVKNYSKWHKRRNKITGEFEPIKALRSDRIYRESCRDTFDIYMDKFMAWHYSREEMIRVSIHELSNSNVTNDCYEKQYDIFTIYQAVFVQMKIDAELTLKALNGDLTGKEFLGITIGEAH